MSGLEHFATGCTVDSERRLPGLHVDGMNTSGHRARLLQRTVNGSIPIRWKRPVAYRYLLNRKTFPADERALIALAEYRITGFQI